MFSLLTHICFTCKVASPYLIFKEFVLNVPGKQPSSHSTKRIRGWLFLLRKGCKHTEHLFIAIESCINFSNKIHAVSLYRIIVICNHERLNRFAMWNYLGMYSNNTVTHILQIYLAPNNSLLQDVNDNPPLFNQSSYRASIAENETSTIHTRKVVTM